MKKGKAERKKEKGKKRPTLPPPCSSLPLLLKGEKKRE